MSPFLAPLGGRTDFTVASEVEAFFRLAVDVDGPADAELS